jgi:membrane peptidoglycan carboxypeptidase
LLANVRSLRITQGGSTITQQLIRNTFLFSERSLLRKIFEGILAIKLEKHYSKDEIFALYFNHVYLGNGIRGFSAAARIIFRRPMSALSEIEICGLLGLLRRPTATFPSASNSSAFLTRQDKVARVLDLTPPYAFHAVTKPNPVNTAAHRRPRLSQIVEHELRRNEGCKMEDIRAVGLTIDNQLQHILCSELRRAAKQAEVDSIAGILLSLETGDVLAEVAFHRGVESHFGYAHFGAIQPGSTFKTFALLAALEQGIRLNQELLSEPFESCCYKSSRTSPWRVRNYGDVYRGTISLLDAFRFSDNTAFARLAELLDVDKLYEIYREYQLCGRTRPTPALILGGHRRGVSLVALAAAYRAVAVGGNYVRPRLVRHVEFANGRFEWMARRNPRVLAGGFTSIRDVQAALLAAGIEVEGHRIAGKTGSTRNGSLFAGYDNRIAATIWTGYTRIVGENDPKAIRSVAVFNQIVRRTSGRDR